MTFITTPPFVLKIQFCTCLDYNENPSHAVRIFFPPFVAMPRLFQNHRSRFGKTAWDRHVVKDTPETRSRRFAETRGFSLTAGFCCLLPWPQPPSPPCRGVSCLPGTEQCLPAGQHFGNHCWRATARRQERQHRTQRGSSGIFGVQVGFSQALFSYAHLSVLMVALLFIFVASLERQTGWKTFTENIRMNVILIILGKHGLTDGKCLA